eukprot:6199334-Pleurochrysis_carterae.AAC.3
MARTAERLYAISCMLLGAVFFAYIVSSLSQARDARSPTSQPARSPPLPNRPKPLPISPLLLILRFTNDSCGASVTTSFTPASSLLHAYATRSVFAEDAEITHDWLTSRTARAGDGREQRAYETAYGLDQLLHVRLALTFTASTRSTLLIRNCDVACRLCRHPHLQPATAERVSRMGSYAILCDLMRSYASFCDLMRSYSIVCDLVRSYAILCDF